MDATIKIEVDFNGMASGEIVIENASGTVPPSKHTPEEILRLAAQKLSSLGRVQVRTIKKAKKKTVKK